MVHCPGSIQFQDGRLSRFHSLLLDQNKGYSLVLRYFQRFTIPFIAFSQYFTFTLNTLQVSLQSKLSFSAESNTDRQSIWAQCFDTPAVRNHKPRTDTSILQSIFISDPSPRNQNTTRPSRYIDETVNPFLEPEKQ